MEDNKALVQVITALEVGNSNFETRSYERNFEDLVAFIDGLIQRDFNRLLNILYRVDISEQKLKQQLEVHKNSGQRTAEIIAQLLVEREQEKIISRAKYRPKS